MKNQSLEQNFSTININSRHYINALEAIIIKIAHALAVEQGISVDPEAIEMTREIVQLRANNLINKRDMKEISKFNKEIAEIIKTTKDQNLKNLAVKTFHLLKLVKLDE